VLLVVILLAAWLAEPSWLAWARHTDRHFVPLVILVVFVTLLAIKWRQHRTDRRQR
jgi:membrane protein DedA with SNARE-associated domain